MRQINMLLRLLPVFMQWGAGVYSVVAKGCRSVRYCLAWLVDAVASPVSQVFHRESWQELERAFSAKVSHQLSIFGRPAKSTGALCSPLLS